MDDKKYELMINALKLVPAIIQGISGAVELYNKLMQALEGGITDEEWAAAITERNRVLDELIAKTAPEPTA